MGSIHGTPSHRRRHVSTLWPFAMLIFLAIAATWSGQRHSGEPNAPEDDGPPLISPPLSAPKSLASFHAVEGISVTLAASEPMVQAPVYATFDEDGRLWVVEMRTYMRDVAATGELVPDNRIVILEDTTGDGVFDTSTIFADRLVLPRGVAPCFGGALVIEPPNLVFLKDTDGDGIADFKKVLLPGFGGRENPEHAGNGLLWGIDNWYEIAQHGVAVRFDGEQIQTRKTPVVGQWGLTRDDEGRLYYVPNSNALIADVYPKHFAVMNPNRSSTPGIGELICPDSTTWPVRPTPGVNRGYMEGTLRHDRTLAKLTAACSPAFYRAEAMGETFRNSCFICEPAGNLVKRLIVKDIDGLPLAENAYKDVEFLTSEDERFRPVCALVSPDGAIYVIDMYRGVIQHRTYMTPYLRSQVKSRGLEQPLNGGRVYRIASDRRATMKTPKLSKASNEELVRLLSHPDGWQRDTAQRLIVQRHATSTIPALRQTLDSAETPWSRIHAMWTIAGLGLADELLQPDRFRSLLIDTSPIVRASAVRLACVGPLPPASQSEAAKLLQDPERKVRMMATGVKGLHAKELAAYLQSYGENKFERSAAIAASHGMEFSILSELLLDTRWPSSEDDKAVLRELADCVLRSQPTQRSALASLMGHLLRTSPDPRANLILDRFRDATRLNSGNPRPLELLAEPVDLVAIASEAENKEVRSVLLYLDWPGRAPVNRPKRARDLTDEEQARFERGKQVFNICAGCHQQDGRGGPGMGAPLAGSVRVNGRVGDLVRVLSHGLQGSFKINGTEYWGVMPPAPLATDEEYAAVLTYIRRSWDNNSDPVTPAQIGAIRSKLAPRSRTWTAEELEMNGK